MEGIHLPLQVRCGVFVDPTRKKKANEVEKLGTVRILV